MANLCLKNVPPHNRIIYGHKFAMHWGTLGGVNHLLSSVQALFIAGGTPPFNGSLHDTVGTQISSYFMFLSFSSSSFVHVALLS